MTLLSETALWFARKRKLQALLSPVLPQTATFKVVDGVQIEIPLRDQTGPAFYLNHGGPQAFYHYEESEKVEILRAMPADGVFLDIGANIGLFSTYIARLLPRSKCFAFEPNPVLAECIRRTARKSPFPQISIEELCLGDREGVLDLHLHTRNSGGNSIIEGNIEAHERGRSIPVRSATLDQWAESQGLSRIDVIKMDVQGAEILVLRGAERTLRKFKPALLVEIENDRLSDPSSDWCRLLSSELMEGYRVRLVGGIGHESDIALSDLPGVAARELSRGLGHSNYLFKTL